MREYYSNRVPASKPQFFPRFWHEPRRCNRLQLSQYSLRQTSPNYAEYHCQVTSESGRSFLSPRPLAGSVLTSHIAHISDHQSCHDLSDFNTPCRKRYVNGIFFRGPVIVMLREHE